MMSHVPGTVTPLVSYATRDGFIRAILDFGQGRLRLEDGKSGATATVQGKLTSNVFGMDLSFAGMPPFDPIALRSADLTGFYPDHNVIIENFGGGLYRATAPTAPGAAREFFRFKINEP